jgi:phage shock protein E
MDNTCETKPGTFKELIKSSWFLRPFLGVVIGGIGGFLYYYFVGCASGTCAITSNPYMSIIFGGLLGFFLVSSPCTRGKC